MSATLFGIVIRETSGKPGWYDVACSQFAGEVSGVSIKGTALAVGQRVAIIQSGGWPDQRKGFGFAETDAGLLSVVETTLTKNWLLDTNPVNGALHYIFSKAGKAQEIYHPARVESIGAGSLTVTDWYTDEPLGAWPVVAGLSASDFEVGDGVLLRLIPNAIRRVEGWWQTVPGSGFDIPGVQFLPATIQPIIYNTGSKAVRAGAWELFEPSSLVSGQANVDAVWFGDRDTIFREGPTVYKYSAADSVPTPEVYSFEELTDPNFTLLDTISTYPVGTDRRQSNSTILFRKTSPLTIKYWDDGNTYGTYAEGVV